MGDVGAATISVCTSVNNLRPDMAPPTRPVSFTVSLTRSEPEAQDEHTDQRKTGVGDQVLLRRHFPRMHAAHP